MRIVFINKVFPNPVEPAKGNFVHKNLMQYPSDIDVEVIAPVPPFLGLRRQRQNRIPLWRMLDLGGRSIRVWHPRFLLFPRNIMRAFVPTFEYLSILPLLWYLHKRKRIDCLHANFCLPDGIAAAKLSNKLGIPFVITEHQAALADLLRIPYLKRMMLQSYIKAHKVIAVSEHTGQIILNAGLPHEKLVVIPNGIDTAVFTPVFHSRGITKLIYIGYLVQRKGVQFLLEAISILGDNSISLSLVGDGEYRNELEKQCTKLGIEESVHFLGEKNPQEIAQLLHDHDALVHPSLIESFGIVVVEAMAAGLPVVATQNGGSEYIVTDQTGIIVPPHDPHALAEGIRRLIATEWDAKAIRNYAVQHYDISEVVNDTIKQYPEPVSKICHLSSVHMRTDVRVFYKQCVSLVQAGYNVHLVVADGQGNELKDGVKIHDVGPFASRKLRMMLAPFKVLLMALSLRADVYQIHDPELLPIAILLKLISRKPVIYDIHECYAEAFLNKDYLSPFAGKLLSKIIRGLETGVLAMIDQGIAATEHIAQQYPDVPVLHNYPILAEWKDVRGNSSRYQSRCICYIGIITRERGIGQIVSAIENVDCSFHLAGKYEPVTYRDELKKMPGFAKVIEYGYVNRDKAAEIFSKCALGVVLFDRSPNHLYSLSTKMFEYMAAGLPILVSDLPTNIELIDESEVGVYLDPDCIEKISDTLNRLLNDPQKLAEMGQKGKKLTTKQLSWENEKDIYLNVYANLLSKS